MPDLANTWNFRQHFKFLLIYKMYFLKKCVIEIYHIGTLALIFILCSNLSVIELPVVYQNVSYQ